LQNALFSVLLALRNHPDRYFIIEKMELTPFTTTIINYNSFHESRYSPYLRGSKQINGKVLEMAEMILGNLQNAIVDSTLSATAGLEVSNHAPYHVLPDHKQHFEYY
jgi:hypothetical protein